VPKYYSPLRGLVPFDNRHWHGDHICVARFSLANVIRVTRAFDSEERTGIAASRCRAPATVKIKYRGDWTLPYGGRHNHMVLLRSAC